MKRIGLWTPVFSQNFDAAAALLNLRLSHGRRWMYQKADSGKMR